MVFTWGLDLQMKTSLSLEVLTLEVKEDDSSLCWKIISTIFYRYPDLGQDCGPASYWTEMYVMREKGAILLVCGRFNISHTSFSCSSVAGHSLQGLLSCPCPSIFIRPLAWVCRDGGHHYLTLSFMQIKVQILTYKFKGDLEWLM